MDAIFDWGIDAILWIRQALPGLVAPFEALTFLGNERFFLLLLPIVYWCVDRPVGARFSVLFLLSTYVNVALKALTDQPRPHEYALDRVRHLFLYPLDEVIERYGAIGGGFPSGHTQNAVALWGYLASRFRRTWLWVVAGLMMLLIPLSRIYLAVHFPHDVLSGYVLGAAALLLFLWLEPRAEDGLAKTGVAGQLAVAVVPSTLMMLLLPDEGGVSTGATLMGLGVGLALERRWIGFESGGAWWKRVLRYLLGIVVLVGLYGGLKAAFAGLEPALLLRFVRYGLMGLWASLGAPWVFGKLRLAASAVALEAHPYYNGCENGC